MKSKLKNIASVLLLTVFLLPSIVKLEHHHEIFICKAKNVGHFHVHHEKCPIKSFEFSFFSTDYQNVKIQTDFEEVEFYIHYKPVFYSIQAKYSFLSRAPPSSLV